jgi:hypothetical protein
MPECSREAAFHPPIFMILASLFKFSFEIPPFREGLQERKLGSYRFEAAAIVCMPAGGGTPLVL